MSRDDFEKISSIQIETLPSKGETKRPIVIERKLSSKPSSSFMIEPPIPPPTENVSIFKSPSAWWKHNYLSWRFYIVIYAGLAFVALFVNVVGFAIAVIAHGINEDGRIMLMDGECSQARRSSLFGHYFISGISTYLLSASAYVMYCLTPPTREEIDKAHAKGKWLDIGAMSWRNVKSVSKKRIFLFMCLGLSSPLLQLFYSSVFFVTNSANAYSAVVATEQFLRKSPPTIELGGNKTEQERLGGMFDNLVDQLHTEYLHDNLKNLSNKECIDEYSQALQSSRRHVVLITENNPINNATVFDVFHAWIPSAEENAPEQFSWICDDHQMGDEQCLFHVQQIRDNPDKWTVSGGARVKYCYSETAQQHCKIYMSVNLMLAVIAVNLFKACIMLCVAFFCPESPLMTTGDALSSFLNRPDPYTQDMCMTTKKIIRSNPGNWPRQSLHYSSKRYRWWDAIKGRMFACAAIMCVALCGAASMFVFANEPANFKDLLTLGFGTINRRYFLGWSLKSHDSMVRSIIIANIGHAVFGMIYIIYNNVFYSYAFQAEWSRFATHRKGLRVSEAPRGYQRTVYFFLMPHKLAFPIMFFSWAIHSMISQSTFFVDVEAYAHNVLAGEGVTTFTRQPQLDFNAIGFSPLGNIGVIFAGFCMMLFLLAMGMRRFKSGMPVVSTCSAAISAACHASHDEEENPQLMKMMWGVTDYEAGDGVSHCTFSAKDVKVPDELTLYA